MSARILNILLGTWLFLSAFAWPHRPVLKVATMVCGLLIMLSSLAAIYLPRLRYAIAAVAVALFIVSLASARVSDTTVWHNTVVAVLVFFIALVDRGPRRVGDASDQLSRPIGDYQSTRTRA